MPDDPACLVAALDYASRGWSVLPLCPPDHVGVGKDHRGCQSPGKRPFFPTKDARSGEWKEFQGRAATEEELRREWNFHPRLNVGMALGPVSGLVGIDVDDEDGDRLLEELSGGDLPRTLEYTTGKGRRLLYRLPAGAAVVNHAFKRPGTEIEILRFMSQGGQVVLPPSVHPNGSTYRWKALHGPDDLPAADAPAWLCDGKPKGGDSFRPADGELITEGGRNNYLTALAGAMRKRGADEYVIAAALAATNETRFDPPLPTVEVDSVARSVCRYAPDEFTGVTVRLPEPGRVPDVPPGDRRFKWASELAAPPKADEWIWKGYLPKGAITLLSALWKAGKTTLLAHLLRALGTGGEFLGQPIRASKVLYVSEEGESHWVRRRDELGFGDHAGFYLQPFGVKPATADWLAFVGQLRADIQAHGFDLVVFDTLAKLWPVREENDAGEVDAALMPLWELTKAGAGVLLIHHLRKSGGTEYTGSRGSGALSAFPDILIELTRFDASDAKCRKRKLIAKGRYDETPDEIVVELADGDYQLVNDPSGSVALSASGGVILRVPELSAEERTLVAVLTDSPEPWMTIDEVRAALKAVGAGTRNKDTNTNLFSLYYRKQVVIRGKLRSKADPRQYALSVRVPSGSAPECVNGNEIEFDEDDGE